MSLLSPCPRTLVETAIETGLRWGEVTELRPRDIDPAARVLTVSSAVVQLNPKFHPGGQRFLVKPYPKDREYRRLQLSQPARAGQRQPGQRLRVDPVRFRMPAQEPA